SYISSVYALFLHDALPISIPPEILEGFRDYLKINIPNDKDFRYTYNTLFHSYFLGFFIGKLQLFDPQEWPRHQEKWAASLLSKSDRKSTRLNSSHVKISYA